MKHLFLLMLMFITTIGISQPTQIMNVRANLYVIGEDGNLPAPGENLYGGALAQYFTNYCNCVDGNDVLKLGGGWSTEMALFRNNTALVAERRDTVNITDTLYLRINNHRNINMMLELSVVNVYPFNLDVKLLDAVTNTITNIPINGSIFKYYFTGVPNAGSYSDTRFRIVLTNPPGFIAPPIYTEFKVYPNPIMRGQTLYIESPNNGNEYYLISSTGIKYKVSATNNTIQLPNLISGMYLLYDPKSKEKKRIVVL